MDGMQAAFDRAKAQGFPALYDHDLICNICGEPWDAYGVRNGDMTTIEATRFLGGRGCPSCFKGKEVSK